MKLIELLTFFFRYSDTEKEVKQLKLEIKSKGEEIQLLQKQMSQNEANNEKVKERLSNMAQEKQQLLERYSLGFVHLNYYIYSHFYLLKYSKRSSITKLSVVVVFNPL